jgi:hypothetical protein
MLQCFWSELFSRFSFYRRRKGGNWYKIREVAVSGMAGDISYWSQDKPQESMFVIIEKEEKY